MGKSVACNFRDRTGEKYSRLTCLEWERRNGYIYWLCRCDCGNSVWVRGINLTSGAVKSCGCSKNHVNRVHGMSHTRIHGIWSKMHERCKNPRSESYKWYGAEGKTVCEEWCGTDGFMRFYDWAISHGYSDDLTIDRIDVDKGYSPENCRWIPFSDQWRNKRTTLFLYLYGEAYTVKDLSIKFGIQEYTIRSRYRWGWSTEEIVGLKKHERNLLRYEKGRILPKQR